MPPAQLAHPDVQVGLMNYIKPPGVLCTMLGGGVPNVIAKWKLGLLTAPELPADVEKRIEVATEAMWSQLRP